MEMNKEKIMIFWSGGKDSAVALHLLKQNPAYEITGLITLLDRASGRVRFHGIPDSLIVEQSKLLKLPLQRIFLDSEMTNEEYKKQIGTYLKLFAKKGIKTFAFGDIHLSDVKDFKTQMLSELDLKAEFPLWGKTSAEVNEIFFESDHKAMVTGVMIEKLGPEFLACEFTREYILRLPPTVDVAGENGEFHTFVTFGPNFKMRVPFSKSMAVDEGPYLVSLLKEP